MLSNMLASVNSNTVPQRKKVCNTFCVTILETHSKIIFFLNNFDNVALEPIFAAKNTQKVSLIVKDFNLTNIKKGYQSSQHNVSQ